MRTFSDPLSLDDLSLSTYMYATGISHVHFIMVI